MTSHDPEVLDALEELGAKEFRGRVWRHMLNAADPFRINVRGARWNPPGVGALYTSLARETAEAEGQRLLDVQPVKMRVRRTVYELDAEVSHVVDLSSADYLDRVKLTLADVQGDDWSACQRVGAAAAWLGYGGLIVPSGRHAGHNLAILMGTGHDHELTELDRHVISLEDVDEEEGSAA